MDVKKVLFCVFTFLIYNLSAQTGNRFLVNAVFQVNNSDITKSENFKMVSIPGDTVIQIKSILPGSAGVNWMAFRETGNIYPIPFLPENEDNFSFSPGKAFWIISKNNIHLGPFTVNKVKLNNNTYSIKLNKGWNLISNPFDISIDWKDVRLTNNLQNDLIYYFYEGYYDNASVKMQPYLGYYYFNRKELTELILPYPSGSSQLHKDHFDKNFFKLYFCNSKDTTSLKIYITKVDDSSISNQPYPLNDFVQFGAAIDLNGEYFSEFKINSDNELNYLPLSIINKNKEALTIFGENYLSEDYQDFTIGIKDNKGKIIFAPFAINENMENNLVLIIGKRNLINSIKEVPTTFIVSQNFPNPFNPNTSINVLLPTESNLTINVYNSIGKQVSQIYNGYLKSGSYNFNFDGTNLSSGVYYYSVTTDYGSINKKMLLLK